VNHEYASLSITLPARWADALSDLLGEVGSLGCEVRGDDPATFVAYFEGGTNLDPVERLLRLRLEEASAAPEEVAIVRGIVPPTDWEATWRRTLAPVRVGRRWLVRPSWLSSEGYDRQTIIIDPKMAFGTGTHATTQLSLIELEDIVRPGMSVLDVGTGTGILAIAAAKLGAGARNGRTGSMPVVGVEIDPVAIDCARENLVLNDMGDRVTLVTGTLGDVPPGRFDIVIANIEFRTLVSLAGDLRDRLGPGGTALFSGILQMEADAFVAQMRRRGWRSIRVRRQYDPMTDDGWILLVATAEE